MTTLEKLAAGGLWANVALKKKREKRSAYEEGADVALGSLGLQKVADDVIYKTRFSGIPVHVDRPKGTKKHYRLHGKTTNITYKNDYGFIPGIRDHDGMDLDVHLGPNKKSDKVFLVQKLKGPPDNLEFDEHKVLLGYDSRRAARNVADYYFSKIRSKNMREMTIPEFKDLIKKGPIPKPKD